VIYILYLYFPYCFFVRISQVIGCVGRLRNDLYCVEWGVKLYSTNHAHCRHLLANFISLLATDNAFVLDAVLNLYL